jgi:7,8-dihydropterin-6-yl-methyl-4-(beta-D-ribofuranosyl)aminobenzene 5'-phosphate synthase
MKADTTRIAILGNTLHYVRQLNQGLRIRVVIGGFHFLNAGERQLERVLAAVQDLAPDQVIPCHCTGDTAIAQFVTAFGEGCCPGAAGMTFLFPPHRSGVAR